jgi:lipopolysaccharide export LptBFGC system permease protein LptF
MIRMLRAVWSLATNGLLIYFFYNGTEQMATLNHLLEQDNRNRTLWLYFALRITAPVAAVLLAFLGSSFAKWVNAGVFTYFGVGFLLIGILNWSDYHGHIYLFLGPVALIIASINLFLFRRPRPAETEASS